MVGLGVILSIGKFVHAWAAFRNVLEQVRFYYVIIITLSPFRFCQNHFIPDSQDVVVCRSKAYRYVL